MDVALGSEVFRLLSFEEACRQAAALGYRALGLHTRREYDPHVFPPRCRGAELKRVKQALEENRLCVSSIRSFANIALDEELERVEHELALARELCCPVVLLGSPAPRAPLASIERMKSFRQKQAERLRALAERAAEAGVTLCLATAPGAFFESTLELGEFLRLVGHPRARFALCTAEVLRCGESLDAAFDAAGDLLGHVSVADVKLSSGGRRVPLGRGEVKLSRLLELLRAEEYEGFLEVDLAGCEGEALAAARESIEQLKRLL